MSALASTFLLFLATFGAAHVCRNVPEDSAWPSRAAWAALNKTVGGRLIRTVPLASVCYDLGVNSSECQKVRSNWHTPELHEQDSASVMAVSASNRSCDPFVLDNGCQIGEYVQYSVNVSAPSDIIAAVKFAKKRNIRFVVKNTGHDYMGKSTGHGALAVWTHHLQKTKWIKKYSSKAYSGPAVKMQSGVLVKDMYRQASDRGLAIVGGLCPTVGMGGGYIQGGGHGPLAGYLGLAADNTLEFEVITTDGRFLTVSPTRHRDLFWALSGGGGGTYAIVWSVTVKVHPDYPITGASLHFTASENVTLDTWWKGVDVYRTWSTKLTDIGGYAAALYMRGAFTIPFSLTLNQTQEEFSSLLSPLLEDLNQLGIPYSSQQYAYPGFLQAYNALLPEDLRSFDASIHSVFIGGRFLPRKSYDDPVKMHAISTSIRTMVDEGASVYEIVVTPKSFSKPRSATLPQWRSTQTLALAAVSLNDTATAAELEEQRNRMLNVWMPKLYQATPGAGAYLNEADPFSQNYKQDFYGTNYDELLKVKRKYDPDSLLYGATSVGGDLWAKQSDGRLCRRGAKRWRDIPELV